MRLTLVRHGETTGESSVRYYGATDVALSALGTEQMRRSGAVLAGERFDALYTSRLCRSREGGRLVAGDRHAGVPSAAFDAVDLGRWEGWTREEIAERDAAEYARWQAAPDVFVYPEGECRQAFRRRVVAGLEALLAADGARQPLLVVHRGVIAIIVAELLGLTPDQRRGLEIDLGSIHVISRDGAGWRAEHLNRVDHLESEMIR
jgi:broad specificity phosphatase PhoE